MKCSQLAQREQAKRASNLLYPSYKLGLYYILQVKYNHEPQLRFSQDNIMKDAQEVYVL